MGFSFFYNLCRLEEKNPQTIEIYDLWENFFLKMASQEKIFLKTASKKVEFRDLIFSCVNASETERNGSKNCFKTHSVERTRGNGAFQYVYTRIVI